MEEGATPTGDDTTGPELTTAEAVLAGVHMLLHYEQPRWVDLSCGHDVVVEATDPPVELPMGVGSVYRCPRCDTVQMVWGVSLLGTDDPELQAIRDMVKVLGARANGSGVARGSRSDLPGDDGERGQAGAGETNAGSSSG
jgi:hypothetical protein